MKKKTIDVAGIVKTKEEDFHVKSSDFGALITPKRSKHVWNLDEIWCRSVLVDEKTNLVLSSGFPKFFNMGEHPEIDAIFQKRFKEKSVEFTEKIDGSLIVVDKLDQYYVHLRTRGNSDLGSFESSVKKLINKKYPNFYPFFYSNAISGTSEEMDRYSFLFEYTSPDNVIILPQTEHSLTFLGIVDKYDLKIVNDAKILNKVSSLLKIPLVRSWKPSNNIKTELEQIKSSKNREGVVAKFLDDNNHLTLLKIKSEQYIFLHSIKFNFTEKKVRTLCYVLEIETEAEMLSKLQIYGLDFEASKYIQPFVRQYLYTKKDGLEAFSMFEIFVNTIKKSNIRKDFVFALKDYISKRTTVYPETQNWFSVGMKLYDDKRDDALDIVWSFIIDEPISIVKSLKQNKNDTIKELLYIDKNIEGE